MPAAMSDDPLHTARRRVRLAVAACALAVCYPFLQDFFVPGVIRGAWHGERAGLFLLPTLAFTIVFPIGVLFFWFLSLPILLLVSRSVQRRFGGHVPHDVWQETTCRALWPLPWAAAAGGVCYVVYCVCEFGGWPDDVILGTILNAVGACCYLTMFRSWYQLRKSHSRTG
jgi:hypothetical protein